MIKFSLLARFRMWFSAFYRKTFCTIGWHLLKAAIGYKSPKDLMNYTARNCKYCCYWSTPKRDTSTE